MLYFPLMKTFTGKPNPKVIAQAEKTLAGMRSGRLKTISLKSFIEQCKKRDAKVAVRG